MPVVNVKVPGDRAKVRLEKAEAAGRVVSTNRLSISYFVVRQHSLQLRPFLCAYWQRQVGRDSRDHVKLFEIRYPAPFEGSVALSGFCHQMTLISLKIFL